MAETRYEGRTLQEWLQDLKSPHPGTRIAAAHALRHFGAASAPFLIHALHDSNLQVRRSATDSLAALGPIVMVELHRALESPHRHVRTGALTALKSVRPHGSGKPFVFGMGVVLGAFLTASLFFALAWFGLPVPDRVVTKSSQDLPPQEAPMQEPTFPPEPEILYEASPTPTEPPAPTEVPTEPPAPTEVPTEPPAAVEVPTEVPPTEVPTEPPVAVETPTEPPAPVEVPVEAPAQPSEAAEATPAETPTPVETPQP